MCGAPSESSRRRGGRRSPAKALRGFWRRVRDEARRLGTDGCTGVPDFRFRRACELHDILYRNGRDFSGRTISRWAADWRFLRAMRATSRTAVERWMLATAYWIGVRIFGGLAWARARGDK